MRPPLCAPTSFVFPIATVLIALLGIGAVTRVRCFALVREDQSAPGHEIAKDPTDAHLSREYRFAKRFAYSDPSNRFAFAAQHGGDEAMSGVGGDDRVRFAAGWNGYYYPVYTNGHFAFAKRSAMDDWRGFAFAKRASGSPWQFAMREELPYA